MVSQLVLTCCTTVLSRTADFAPRVFQECGFSVYLTSPFHGSQSPSPTLHLHKCQSSDPPLHFETFLDVLAICAELEELRLHMFISTIAHWRSGAERDISLSRLRKLVVGDVPLVRQ